MNNSTYKTINVA